MVIAFQLLQFGGQAGSTSADGLEGSQAVRIEVVHLLLQLLDATERSCLTGNGGPANLGGRLQLTYESLLKVALPELVVDEANSTKRQNPQHKLGSGHIHTGITSRT
ncbi:hypothetical protein [Pseudomonas alloputida]|uniref:hypothetical protein n=1 Tax=Pseudomonas alloputida TaxID=1940621 RepID=UPI0039FBDA70